MSNSSSGRKQKNNITTPSGVTYDQFLKMSLDEQVDLIEKIIDDNNIKVPDYLDKSQTSKVIYALGINNKPEMLSDKELDSLSGETLYRTVSDTKDISAKEIIDQIKTADYTQLSGVGGSYYGRALYFANSFSESANYGTDNSIMMRAKLKPTAKIEDYNKLTYRCFNDVVFGKSQKINFDDMYSLYALAKGYDGLYDKGSGYMMILNRGSLVTSPQNKKLSQINTTWDGAPDA